MKQAVFTAGLARVGGECSIFHAVFTACLGCIARELDDAGGFHSRLARVGQIVEGILHAVVTAGMARFARALD